MTESSKPREPLVGFMVIEDYTEDYSDWSGQIAFPDPVGANLYWQNTIPMIEKRAHDAALARIKLLEEVCAELMRALKLIADDLDIIGITPTEISHLAISKNSLASARETIRKTKEK